jgi:hypothetical protein
MGAVDDKGMDGEGGRGGAVKTISDIESEEREPVRPVARKLQSTDLRSGLVLTIGAWLGSRIVVGAAWGPSRNPFSFATSLWMHSDSFNYVTIAMHGRVFGRCGSPAFPNDRLSLLWHLKWCGNAGWLPGYPWLMDAMHWLGISWLTAGVLISWVATAVAIFLVWFEWGRDLPAPRALALLLLFGIFPGSVYNFAVFPTAIALACVVGAMVTATRERFFSAALLMTLAGLCYPTAWFAALGLAGGLILIALPLGPLVIRQRALWGLAGLSSLLVLGIHDQIAFEQPAAYFFSDSGAVGSVLATGHDFYQLFVTRDTVEQTQMGRASAPLLSLQVLIAIGISFAGVAITGRQWLRKQRHALLVYPAMIGITVVLALSLTNSQTWNRSVVLAAPCVVCLRRVRMPLLWVIVGIVGITTALISRSFFNGSFY